MFKSSRSSFKRSRIRHFECHVNLPMIESKDLTIAMRMEEGNKSKKGVRTGECNSIFLNLGSFSHLLSPFAPIEAVK